MKLLDYIFPRPEYPSPPTNNKYQISYVLFSFLKYTTPSNKDKEKREFFSPGHEKALHLFAIFLI